MSEVKVNNGNIEDALKRFKRKNQRLQEKENFNKIIHKKEALFA